MTKRFFAIILSLFLLFTGVFLTACNKDKKNESDDTTSEAAPLSAKDKFVAAIESLVSADTSSVPTSPFQEMLDIEGKNGLSISGGITINELSVQGQSPFGDSPLSVELDGIITKEMGVAIDGILSLGSEKLNAELVYADRKTTLFFEDLMDAPVFIGEDDKDEEDGAAASTPADVIKKLEPLKKLPDIFKKYCAMLSEGMIDSMFSEAQKDVTVGDKEYKNAQILTFNLSKQEYSSVASVLVAAMKEDQDVIDILTALDEDGDFELKELDEIVNDTISVKAELAVADGTVVSGTLTFTDEPDEGDEDDKAEVNTITYTAEKGDSDTKHSIKIAEEDAVLMETNYTVKNDGSSMDSTAIIYEDGKKISESTCTVTKEGNVLNYSLVTASFEDDKKAGGFAVEYSESVEDNSVSVNITKITVNTNGVDVSIPVDLSVAVSMNKDSINLNANLELAMKDAVTAYIEMALEIKGTDETVAIPDNAIDESEFDSTEFSQKFAAKYPTIMALLGSGTDDPQDPSDPGDDEVEWVDFCNSDETMWYTFYSDGWGYLEFEYDIISNKNGRAVLNTASGKTFEVNYSNVTEDSFEFNNMEYAYEYQLYGDNTKDYTAYNVIDGDLWDSFWMYEDYGVITVSFLYKFDFENEKIYLETCHGDLVFDCKYVDSTKLRINGTQYLYYEG